MPQHDQFRNDLKKIMPGYKWTVHKPLFEGASLDATGIQTAGFNRMSTVQVTLVETEGSKTYTVKSAGFGAKARWRHTTTGRTLAQAFRDLQTHYEREEQEYRSLANALKAGRSA